MNFPKAVDKMPNLWYNYGQNMPHMPKKQKAEVQTMKRLLQHRRGAELVGV